MPLLGTRVETYPFAREAVRKVVFNALIHCNWADNVPVQIRIEEDAMFVSNCSMLLFGWTAETLLGTHTSKPYNPDIARVFYRAGYIESWGRGIQKICDALNDALGDKLMMLLKENPYLTQKEMLEKLSVSRATVQRLIKKLIDEKKLERVGGKRYGYWMIREYHI